MVTPKAETKHAKKTLTGALAGPLQYFKRWWNVQELDAWVPAIKMAHVIKTLTLPENFRDLDSWWRVAVRLPVHVYISL